MWVTVIWPGTTWTTLLQRYGTCDCYSIPTPPTSRLRAVHTASLSDAIMALTSMFQYILGKKPPTTAYARDLYPSTHPDLSTRYPPLVRDKVYQTASKRQNLESRSPTWRTRNEVLEYTVCLSGATRVRQCARIICHSTLPVLSRRTRGPVERCCLALPVREAMGDALQPARTICCRRTRYRRCTFDHIPFA